MVRLKDGVDYKKQGRVPTLATPDAAFLKRNRVELDWYPRIKSMSSGRGGEVAVAVKRHQDWLQDRHVALIDIDRIFFDLVRLKNERAWYNFNLTPSSIRDLLGRTDWYDLYIPAEEMEGRSFAQVRIWQEIATALMKKYCERFYKWQKAAFENDKMELKILTPDDPNFAMEYRILIEESAEEIIAKVKELKAEIAAGTFRKWTFQGVTSVFFANNLYQPLLHVKNDLVEVRPVTLNDGEKQFVEDLQAYCEKHKAFFANKELYLLRNRSRGGGIGFFEAGNFYPDFIVWIVEGNHQYITFVDPKGIRNLEGLEDPKIKFHETIKGLEERLGDGDVTMNSFIISVTPSQQVLWWTEDISREELEAHNVLFQTEDRDHYIRKLIQGSMTQPRAVVGPR